MSLTKNRFNIAVGNDYLLLLSNMKTAAHTSECFLEHFFDGNLFFGSVIFAEKYLRYCSIVDGFRLKSVSIFSSFQNVQKRSL